MNSSSTAALAALQVMTIAGGLALDHAAVARTPEQQKMTNQLSLAAIEKSWLAIPRICKAVGFNAQPTPLAPSARSAANLSLYASFTS